MRTLIKQMTVAAVLAVGAAPALAQSSALDVMMGFFSSGGGKMNSRVGNAFFKVEMRSTDEFMKMYNAMSDEDKAVVKAMCTGIDKANAEIGEHITAMCRAAGY